MSDLDFTSFVWEEKEVKVRLKDGSIGHYTLGVVTGEQQTKFTDANEATAIFNEEGKVTGFKDQSHLPFLLLSMCLRDNNGNPVSEDVLRNQWPGPIVLSVFKAAKRLSKMDSPSPVNELLTELFKRPDAPTDLKSIRRWFRNMPEGTRDQYKEAIKLFEETDEEKAKNSPGKTDTGSD